MEKGELKMENGIQYTAEIDGEKYDMFFANDCTAVGVGEKIKGVGLNKKTGEKFLIGFEFVNDWNGSREFDDIVDLHSGIILEKIGGDQ